jgi:hypothetical protein
MGEDKGLEYIAISVVDATVHSITPSTPQIESLLDSIGQALKMDIGVALNKMAEYGYHLRCPAPISLGAVHPDKASYILFMEREKYPSAVKPELDSEPGG